MKKQVSLLTLGLLITLLAGTSACKKDKPGETDTSATIGAEGGVYSFGDVRLVFPKGSLDHEITIDGTFESLDNLPEHITPVGNLHRFHLSHPEAYNANTATIEFAVSEMTTGASIFHSSDGSTWSNLKGVYDGTKISTTIPGFSLFVTGSGSYTVNFINNSSSEETFIVYQYGHDVLPINGGSFVYAWLGVDELAPGSQQSLSWSGGYSFYYTQPGKDPGILELPYNQVLPTHPTHLNEIDILQPERPNWNWQSVYSANQRTSSADSLGYLIINSHYRGVNGTHFVCCGIMMKGSSAVSPFIEDFPVFGALTLGSDPARERYSFKVSSTIYYVARYTGVFTPDTELDYPPITDPDVHNVTAIGFPIGIFTAEVAYQGDSLLVVYL